MQTLKEAAKGALALTVGSVGLLAMMVCAMWLADAIYQIGGRAAVIVELVAFIFLLLFLAKLFSDRVFGLDPGDR